MSKEKVNKNVDEEIKKRGKLPIIGTCKFEGKEYITHVIGGDFIDSPEYKEIRELEKNTGFGFIENSEIIKKRLNKPINKEEIIASLNPLAKKMYQEMIEIMPDGINYNLLKCEFENKKMKIYEDFAERTGERT